MPLPIVLPLLVPLLLSRPSTRPLLAPSIAPTVEPSWRGELTLTMRGDGTIHQPLSQGGRMTVTWKVDRLATGQIILDQSFKGAGIARTESARDTSRYETWIARRAQPLAMTVRDTGSYTGPVGTARTYALDRSRYSCPAADRPDAPGQIRSGILQFDRVKGTYAFEMPRLFSRCDVRYLRTPTRGDAAWMARGPFEMLSGPIELEFEMTQLLAPLESWRVLTGPAPADATELTLSRTFTFQWMNPTEDGKAPVTAVLQLVLRRTP